MKSLELTVHGERHMEAVGGRMASALGPGQVILFRGELGAGKTTLVRGLLRGLGYRGPVKSPSYTLVEPYTVGGMALFHFDLYRLDDPEELEHIGIRDYVDGDGVCLVEWPERAEGMFVHPDVEIVITRQDGARTLHFRGYTGAGAALLAGLG